MEAPRIVRLGRGVSVPFHGGRSHLVLGWRLGPRLGRVLDEGRFDIVHTHCPLVPTLPLLALRARGARVVGTFHTAGSNARYAIAAPALRRLLRGLDAGVAVSEPARLFAERFYDGPLSVIPNGIDLERFHPNGCRPRRGPRVILSVGRFEARKGHRVLLEAFARVRARCDAVLVLVGDGPLAASLRRKASRLDAQGIHFTGAVPPHALPDYYRAADLFVAPALKNESFGIVLLEAMASGLPIVASDIPGYRSVLGEGACYVRPGDARDLASAIADLLRDPERRRALAGEGRTLAVRYRWCDVAARVEELYLDLLAAGGTRA
jgi:phosphatidylinositol alpha-mannosyltransferase